MAGMTGICPEPCRSSLRSLSPKRAGLEEKDADQPIGVGKQDPPKFKLVVTNGNDLGLELDASGHMLARTRIGKHELGGDGSWILGGKKACVRPALAARSKGAIAGPMIMKSGNPLRGPASRWSRSRKLMLPRRFTALANAMGLSRMSLSRPARGFTWNRRSRPLERHCEGPP